MISDRKKKTLLSILLAIPPVAIVAAVCNNLLPPPEPVSPALASNDQLVDIQRDPRSSVWPVFHRDSTTFALVRQ